MTDQENNNSISSNPFAALFGSVAAAKHFAAVQKQQQLRQLTGGKVEGGPGAGAGFGEGARRSAWARAVPRDAEGSVMQARRRPSARMTPTTVSPRAWTTVITQWPRSAAHSARSESSASSSTSTT